MTKQQPWDGFKWDRSTWVVLTDDFWENIKRLLKASKETKMTTTIEEARVMANRNEPLPVKPQDRTVRDKISGILNRHYGLTHQVAIGEIWELTKTAENVSNETSTNADVTYATSAEMLATLICRDAIISGEHKPFAMVNLIRAHDRALLEGAAKFVRTHAVSQNGNVVEVFNIPDCGREKLANAILNLIEKDSK
jgi:hypothetical protein